MRSPYLQMPAGFAQYAAGKQAALAPLQLAGLGGIGTGEDYSALAPYNYVAADGSIVITDPYSSGFPVGTTIRTDGTIIMPDGSVYGADGSYYPPQSATVQTADGSTFNVTGSDVMQLLTAGIQLARVWVTGTATYTPGVPLPSPTTYPYQTNVRAPDGSLVTYPANQTIPAGYTVLSTGSGTGMNTNTLLIVGGIGLLAVLLLGNNRQGK